MGHPFNVLHFTSHGWHWSGRASWSAKSMPLNSLWFGGFEDINNISFIWKEKSSIHVQLIYTIYLHTHTILIHTNTHACTHTKTKTTQEKSVSPILWYHSGADYSPTSYNAHFSTIMLFTWPCFQQDFHLMHLQKPRNANALEWHINFWSVELMHCFCEYLYGIS